MNNYELIRIVFSDESNYKKKVIVRRHHNEKYHSRFIVPRLQGGGGSVGILGCITYDGPGLHMLCDGRMDQHRYIDTLENYLMPTSPIGCINKTMLYVIKQSL